MNLAYRATKRNTPSKDETLIGSRTQAEAILADLDKKLRRKPTSQQKFVYLAARATIYEALGDRKMLEAAYDAFNYYKTSVTAALVAVALHHFGRIKESLEWYKRSYSYPHEAGFEIDIGYSGALLFEGNWLKAWPIVKQLKKRMVYALYLNFWDGKPCKEVSIVSEGGFGDLLQNCRYLPLVAERAEKVIVYLPDYFFEHGFADMARLQPWFPEIKPLLQLPQDVPAAGFFDLPAIFETTPDTIPNYPQKWIASEDKIQSFKFLRSDKTKPRVGFCYGARAMETPLVAPGIYRTLTDEQTQRIVSETEKDINWFSLQYNPEKPVLGLPTTPIKSWEDTAAIIENLDAVVTVDTGVMHLACVMQKPVHVLLSGATDWKFMLDGDCPWYPTAKVWRNRDFGFDNTVNDIIRALDDENRFIPYGRCAFCPKPSTYEFWGIPQNFETCDEHKNDYSVPLKEYEKWLIPQPVCPQL